MVLLPSGMITAAVAELICRLLRWLRRSDPVLHGERAVTGPTLSVPIALSRPSPRQLAVRQFRCDDHLQSPDRLTPASRAGTTGADGDEFAYHDDGGAGTDTIELHHGGRCDAQFSIRTRSGVVWRATSTMTAR
jgi:hypothetical protein